MPRISFKSEDIQAVLLGAGLVTLSGSFAGTDGGTGVLTGSFVSRELVLRMMKNTARVKAEISKGKT